jgi:hypothetical protein
MDKELSDAISAVYQAFARYSCDRLVQSDVDCAHDTTIDELSAKVCGADIRSLNSESLLDYYYLAVSHIGDTDDLRHFLPRILELVVTEPKGYLDPKLLAETLRRADAHEMADPEKASIRNLLRSARGILASRILSDALRAVDPGNESATT